MKLGYIQEVELTKMLARQYRMPAVDLSKFEVDPKIAKLIPTDLATKNLVLPLKRDGRTLTVAIADPTNLGIIEDLKFITRYDIFPVIAGEFTLRNTIEKYYEASDSADAVAPRRDRRRQRAISRSWKTKDDEPNAAALAAAVDDAPVVKLINAIMTDAVKRGASDIHFECFEHELRVRYRIDGALQEVMKPPLKMKAGAHLALQDHVVAQHRGASRPAGRAHQAEDGQEGHRLSRVDAARRCSARRSCSGFSTRAT